MPNHPYRLESISTWIAGERQLEEPTSFCERSTYGWPSAAISGPGKLRLHEVSPPPNAEPWQDRDGEHDAHPHPTEPLSELAPDAERSG